MRKKSPARKIILIIAGPNGTGKTTLAQAFLRPEGFPEFINADLIAQGVSPLSPESSPIQAGKIMLEEIREKVRRGESFAFETTLAGLSYSRYIPQWQKIGYQVKLVFLGLPSAEAAIVRVQFRKLQGGHSVQEDVIRRPFDLGIKNFENIYSKLVDSWVKYDNSGDVPRLTATSENP